ncbi:MAG: hypothetical protein KDJ17_07265 [Hyphomicrobiaceae bacterium]|nr:hypothetical protein [Hyphomicrobiaceae bacterium]
MIVVEEDCPQTVAPRVDRQTIEDILAKPRFTIGEVCKASDVSAETVRSWFKRDIISLSDEERLGHDPEAKGLGRMLTGYTAMAVAIMARLTIVRHRARQTGGYNLDAAKDAAYTFVFAGSEDRMPCHLFRDGITAMLIAKDGRYPMARIVNLGDAGQESWEQLRKAAGATAQFEILLLDELWQTVFQRLGIRAELERAG